MPPQKKKTTGDDSGALESGGLLGVIKRLKNIKENRNESRAAIEEDFEEATNELQGRLEEKLAENTGKIEEAQLERVRHLIRVMERRDELENAIAARLGETQDEFWNITMVIKSAYDRRLEEVKEMRNAVPPKPQENCDPRKEIGS